jgi:hypothetical protein
MENIRKALNKTSQLMQKLAQAGLTEELINIIINSPDNQMAETMILSISGKVKNKFLKQIHQDATGIVHKMYGPNACFEELFGSLCGHSKGKDTISSLMEKLKKTIFYFLQKKQELITSNLVQKVEFIKKDSIIYLHISMKMEMSSLRTWTSTLVGCGCTCITCRSTIAGLRAMLIALWYLLQKPWILRASSSFLNTLDPFFFRERVFYLHLFKYT